MTAVCGHSKSHAAYSGPAVAAPSHSASVRWAHSRFGARRVVSDFDCAPSVRQRFRLPVLPGEGLGEPAAVPGDQLPAADFF